jgi:RNA polymerase sigma-70 factor (ECF subfamily)
MQEEPIPPRERFLVESSRGGDAAAFAALVRESAPALERLALRLVGDRHQAEDVAQEAVFRAWRKLPGFRGDSRFKTWICRILVRRALDFLRRKEPEAAAPVDVAVADDTAARAEGRETERLLRAAIEELPPVQRATLLLRADQDLTYEEIAWVLGSSRDAVRMNLIAARKRLAERLRGRVDLGEGR